MYFEVNNVRGSYIELKVTELESGMLNKKQAIELLIEMSQAVSDMLQGIEDLGE